MHVSNRFVFENSDNCKTYCLSEESKNFLDSLSNNKDFKPFYTQTPDEARNNISLKKNKIDSEKLEILDTKLPISGFDTRVRIYRPKSMINGEIAYPVLVYFHGGGWVMGSLESCHTTCQSLAEKANCIVISVDYKLAPENKFPSAPQEAYAVTKYLYDHAQKFNIDVTKFAVAGNSAGANLAAVVCNMAKEVFPISCQILNAPATDLRCNTNSYSEFADGYYFTKKDMEWFIHHYTNNENDILNPLASPFLFENIKGLPPALIINAELDIVRDDGRKYAEKLRQHGVLVEYLEYCGLIHCFFTYTDNFSSAFHAHQKTADFLRKIWSD